jgi:hypothetical protein
LTSIGEGPLLRARVGTGCLGGAGKRSGSPGSGKFLSALFYLSLGLSSKFHFTWVGAKVDIGREVTISLGRTWP